MKSFKENSNLKLIHFNYRHIQHGHIAGGFVSIGKSRGLDVINLHILAGCGVQLLNFEETELRIVVEGEFSALDDYLKFNKY